MIDTALLERALGAYVGFAIGDALGATVEFMTEREIAATYRVHREIIGGGWLRLDPGEVTDDTGMCLALGDAIVSTPDWDLHRVAQHFVLWLRSKPVDIGNTCRRGIRRFMTEGSLTGTPNEADAGNGAAMRNLPVVISTLNDEEAFEERSLAQCHVTHCHALSDAGTLALGRVTRALLLGGGLPAAAREIAATIEESPKFRFHPFPGQSTGYIVDTVQTVFDAFMTTDSFEACVVKAVNRGGDADTTGALAGQLAGALYGWRAIPVRWLRRLDPVILDRIRHQTPALLAKSGVPVNA